MTRPPRPGRQEPTGRTQFSDAVAVFVVHAMDNHERAEVLRLLIEHYADDDALDVARTILADAKARRRRPPTAGKGQLTIDGSVIS